MKRAINILKNTTKITKTGLAVLEIFNVKDHSLDIFLSQKLPKTKDVVF